MGRIFLLVVVLSTSGCHWFGKGFDGYVRDRETREPIEGAIIVYQAYNSVPFQGSHCVKMLVDTSDEYGYFKIPYWYMKPHIDKLIRKRSHYTLDIYMKGYERTSNVQNDSFLIRRSSGDTYEIWKDREGLLSLTAHCSSEFSGESSSIVKLYKDIGVELAELKNKNSQYTKDIQRLEAIARMLLERIDNKS